MTIEVPHGRSARGHVRQHTTNKPIAAVAVGVVDGKPVIVSGRGGRLGVRLGPRPEGRSAPGAAELAVRSLAVTRPGAERPGPGRRDQRRRPGSTTWPTRRPRVATSTAGTTAE